MKRLSSEDRAGLYTTVIVHLVVLIILLAAGLGASLKRSEDSFVLDFTKLEEAEQLRQELSFREQISRRLDEMLSAGGAEPVRNVAVDRGALKDDRGTDAEQLYKDAERLRQELKGGFEAPSEDEVAVPEKKRPAEQKAKDKPYSGPSVVSYELQGRKASRLPIPAYRCMGAGQVTVLITVDPQGNVTGARIDEATSSPDGCLRAFAVRAARLSKFSASASAPARQGGNIIYSFIAQ